MFFNVPTVDNRYYSRSAVGVVHLPSLQVPPWSQSLTTVSGGSLLIPLINLSQGLELPIGQWQHLACTLIAAMCVCDQ